MKKTAWFIGGLLAVLLIATFVFSGTVTKGTLGKQDIRLWYSGNSTQTFNRTTSQGYTMTLNALDWVGIDVHQVYGGGVNKTNTVLASAASDVGYSTKRQMWLDPGTWTVTASLDISDYKDLYWNIPPGAVIDVATGCTLTFPSPANIIASPNQQIFSGAGTVVFATGGTVYPNWWSVNTTPGTTDMTSAIAAAIASTNGDVVLLPEIYGVKVPTSITLEGGATKCSVVMKSNMHLKGTIGKSTIYLISNTSSNASPIYFNIFASNAYLTDVSFEGIVFDLNGANNKINMTKYNTASMIWSGTDARVDRLLVKDCVFKNTPGATCIGMGQSNTALSLIGDDIRILNNLFSNNGLDSPDHSSIYLWSKNNIVTGNILRADAMPGNGLPTVGIEIHGPNTEISNNEIINFTRGLWIATNLTENTYNIDIHDNKMKVNYNGMAFYRDKADETAIFEVKIHNNQIEITNDNPYTTGSTYKAGVIVAQSYTVSSVFIYDNEFYRQLGATYSIYGVVVGTTVAGQKTTNVHIYRNTFDTLTCALYINNTIGLLGNVFFEHNTILNMVTGTTPASDGIGIYIASGVGLPTDFLYLAANKIISSEHTGIYLSGEITTLFYDSDNFISGSGVANYTEAGLTITTRYGYLRSVDAIYDPGSLADGAGETSGAITVTGAVLGDTVKVSAPYDLQGITATGYVSAANAVRIRLENETGGVIDLASGIWKVKVEKQE